MFLVLLTYQKPLAEVDRFVSEHREFLARQYEAGHFLLSGRKEPRSGGVILASSDSREQLEMILRQDPFHREHIATYEMIEFLPNMAAPGLAHLKIG